MTEINVAEEFEAIQQEIQIICEELHKYREGRRAVALAITKLEEARLWLGEAIATNDGP